VLRRRSLHEQTNVADGERHARSCVGEVAKAPHKAPVLCGVHFLYCRGSASASPSLE
jgi:hypothetical protein